MPHKQLTMQWSKTILTNFDLYRYMHVSWYIFDRILDCELQTKSCKWIQHWHLGLLAPLARRSGIRSDLGISCRCAFARGFALPWHVVPLSVGPLSVGSWNLCLFLMPYQPSQTCSCSCFGPYSWIWEACRSWSPPIQGLWPPPCNSIVWVEDLTYGGSGFPTCVVMYM